MGTLQTKRGALRRRIADALKRRARQGARDERGAVAIIFALSIVVLVPLVLGLFDLYTASEQKARLQDAVDAAALYAARSELMRDTEINALATKALTANLKLLRGATLVSSNFRLANDGTTVVGSATIQPMAIAPALWTHNQVSVGTEVVRNSKNLEVALVLDLTGSMSGTKAGDLKAAATELVNMVVKDAAQQNKPYYSKAALVPWAAAVNLGANANTVRGAVVGTNTISSFAGWMNGSQLDVSGASQTKPIVITTNTNHNFTAGQVVMLTGISGMTAINGVPYKVKLIANKPKEFALQTLGDADVDGTKTSTYKAYQTSSSDKVAKCAQTDCTMVVTTMANHGYADGDFVYLEVGGSSALKTALKKKTYAISGASGATFRIFDYTITDSYTSGSGGNAYCTKYGCAYYRFTATNNAIRVHKASTCVTERTGSEIATDAAPSTRKMGFYYPAETTRIAETPSIAYNNPCILNEIVPLTSDKDALTGAIAAMAPNNNKTEGTTGGQVGTAWGWYVLSPNFNSLWSNNGAAAYTATDTLKVAVLMTDGALNTAFCNGVVSSDSTPDYAYMAPDHINCPATNGKTFAQSLALCAAMKQAGIKIYTVGFQIQGDVEANSFVETCASSKDHMYKPNTGTALKDAFKQIGAELNNLRLAK